MKFSEKTIGLVCTMFGILMVGPSCLALTILGVMSGVVNELQPNDPRFAEMMGGFGRFFIIFGFVWALCGLVYLGLGIMILRESPWPLDWLRPVAFCTFGLAVVAMIGYWMIAAQPFAAALFVADLVTMLFVGGWISLFPSALFFMLNRRTVEAV